jgi:hypothetical protein
MILGDNIFYGNGFGKILKKAVANAEENGRATVFGYYVNDPERFGIVEFDENGKVLSIEEKPKKPKSNYAATGLYFYPSGVSQMAKEVTPSARGELEITTLNEMYLHKDKLDVQLLGRGFAWLDTGTMDSLVDAADFVRMLEKRQGVKISAPEEIAFRNGWINKDELLASFARVKALEDSSTGGQIGFEVNGSNCLITMKSTYGSVEDSIIMENVSTKSFKTVFKHQNISDIIKVLPTDAVEIGALPNHPSNYVIKAKGCTDVMFTVPTMIAAGGNNP